MSTWYQFDEFQVDPGRRTVVRDGQDIPLPSKAFDLLLLFLECGNRLVSKDELLERLWSEVQVQESNLTQTVFLLRKALGESAQHRRYIITLPGKGYRFAPEVRTPEATGAPAVLREPQVAPAIQSLAVLPLEVLGVEPSYEYLGVGIADALITRLASLRNLRVRPTLVVSHYSKGRRDPLKIGRELGVDVVVAGAIRQDANRIRTTVQVIGLQHQCVLWSGQSEGELDNIFSLQDKICEQVASALELQPTTGERSGLTRRGTSSPQAYQAYLKGRYFWSKRTPEGFRKAATCFELASADDPSYALAHAGIADCYNLLACYALMSPAEAWSRAKAAALRALTIDDGLPEAHAALSLVQCPTNN